MTHPTDSYDAAKRMQDSINQTIAEECGHLPPELFKAAAQQVIDTDPRMEGWEYVWSEPIGQRPSITLTRYIRPEHKE